MNKEQLKKLVDEIISISRDYECAHSREDGLHLILINEFCPQWVKDEITRLSESDFDRHCA